MYQSRAEVINEFINQGRKSLMNVLLSQLNKKIVPTKLTHQTCTYSKSTGETLTQQICAYSKSTVETLTQQTCTYSKSTVETLTQQTCTYSKSTVETLENDVTYV